MHQQGPILPELKFGLPPRWDVWSGRPGGSSCGVGMQGAARPEGDAALCLSQPLLQLRRAMLVHAGYWGLLETALGTAGDCSRDCSRDCCKLPRDR